MTPCAWNLAAARRGRALLSALVLVAAAATEALSGLPGRRPGRGAGLGGGLCDVPRPPRAGASNTFLALPALGVSDRRSNLYRRIAMLVQDHEPLEHRCRTIWSVAAAMAAAARDDCRRLGPAARRRSSRPAGRSPRRKRPPRSNRRTTQPMRGQAQGRGPEDGDAALHRQGQGDRHRQADRGGHGCGPALDPQAEQREHDPRRRPGTPPTRTGPTRSRSRPSKSPSAFCISSSTSNTPTTPRRPGSATRCR